LLAAAGLVNLQCRENQQQQIFEKLALAAQCPQNFGTRVLVLQNEQNLLTQTTFPCQHVCEADNPQH